jgi:hypothetical protein
MVFIYVRIGDLETTINIYSRRGAENAERLTGIRRSDLSRELSMFATKVAPTDNNKSLRSLRLCEKTGC